jgi:low temperature requirement protein LtrA
MNASKVDVLQTLPIGFAATLLVFALWWLYFKVPFVHALHDHDLKRGVMFGYGHYFIFAALAAVGTGLELVADNFVQTNEHAVSSSLAIITLAVAVGVYMLTLSIIRAAVVKQVNHKIITCLASIILPALAALTATLHLLPLWLSLLILALAPIVMIWLYGDCEHAETN